MVLMGPDTADKDNELRKAAEYHRHTQKIK